MTFSADDFRILDLWLETRSNPHTRDCYRRDAKRLLAYSGKPLNSLTLRDLQAFAQSLTDSGLAPVSRVRTLAAIKSLFGFCLRTRYIASNPAAELALPACENRLAERILGEQDVQEILDAEDGPRDRALLHLLYAAGLRVSEACRLRWRNLRPWRDAGQVASQTLPRDRLEGNEPLVSKLPEIDLVRIDRKVKAIGVAKTATVMVIHKDERLAFA